MVCFRKKTTPDKWDCSALRNMVGLGAQLEPLIIAGGRLTLL